MWIRSQDNRLLINVDNVCVGGEVTKGKYEVFKIGEHFNYRLGIYSSEEKALAVLDEIHGILDAKEWDISDLSIVFEMPLDDEVKA